jgi:intracellular multiplication protein IcmD
MKHSDSFIRLTQGLFTTALIWFGLRQANAAQQTLGDVADHLTLSFGSLAHFITSLGFILGLGFFVAAIMKFKQHKDNPTQIPIGTPIALVFLASALLFMPTLLDVMGATLFGPGNGVVGGPSGVVFVTQNTHH